ncbi:MAG: hypothetical protein ACE5F1_02230, partial [Planctomycetota bacterium]
MKTSILGILLLLFAALQGSGSQGTGRPGKKQDKPGLPELPEKQTQKAGAAAPSEKEGGEGAPLNPITGRPHDPARQSEQSDLIQRFPRDNPLLGVWRLHQTSRSQGFRQQATGYLIFTRAYLSIHTIQGSAVAPIVKTGLLFQSSIRSYRILGNRLLTSSLLGVRNNRHQTKILVETQPQDAFFAAG